MTEELVLTGEAVAPVYVDALFFAEARDPVARLVGRKHGHMWCHLWSSDLERLHALARKIGMKREWFQNKPGFPHYDLVPPRRLAALRLGAVEMDLREWCSCRTGTIGDGDGPSPIRGGS